MLLIFSVTGFLLAFALNQISSGFVAYEIPCSIGLLIAIAVGWRAAIRGRSFGILGFSDLRLRKPMKVKLDRSEKILLATGIGLFLGSNISVVIKLATEFS